MATSTHGSTTTLNGQQGPGDAAPPARTIDASRYREVLGHYPTGVVVVTGIDEAGEPVGMTIGSFTSVSLDPPLIAFLPARGSRSFQRLRTASTFVVNVLAADQEAVCRTFATPGSRPFEEFGWTPSPGGAPVLDGVVAWIECSYHDVAPTGDHYLVMGRVSRLMVTQPVQPLLFFQGGYGRFVPSSLMGLPDADVIEGVRIAELARPEMDGLACDLGVECSLMSRGATALVVVAVTAAPGMSAGSSVGSRVPLRAPLGDLYIAWRGPAETARWLERVPEERHGIYLRRLETARKRGWSMAMVGERPASHLNDLLAELSAGELTPSRHRDIITEMTAASAAYEPVDIVADAQYDVQSIVAPIFGPDGAVAQVLRLSQLPREASGEQVQQWIDALTSAADRVSVAVGAAAPCGADE